MGRGLLRETKESGMVLSMQENGGVISEMRKMWRFGDEGQVTKDCFRCVKLQFYTRSSGNKI